MENASIAAIDDFGRNESLLCIVRALPDGVKYHLGGSHQSSKEGRGKVSVDRKTTRMLCIHIYRLGWRGSVFFPLANLHAHVH